MVVCTIRAAGNPDENLKEVKQKKKLLLIGLLKLFQSVHPIMTLIMGLARIHLAACITFWN